ncbi:MAG: hypothetical protein WBM40_09400 [Thiohalocapsa sp.]
MCDIPHLVVLVERRRIIDPTVAHPSPAVAPPSRSNTQNYPPIGTEISAAEAVSGKWRAEDGARSEELKVGPS